MRLSRRPKPFDSDDYLFELKIDGFRALARIGDGKGELVSSQWERVQRIFGARYLDG
jgi:ATP-dependent DNA ligase